MQSDPDRDDYVSILIENIQPGTANNFKKLNSRDFDRFGTPYDYLSVMHYGNRAFSWNGEYTIVPTDLEYLHQIGQRERLSEGDIERLNNMYECQK